MSINKIILSFLLFLPSFGFSTGVVQHAFVAEGSITGNIVASTFTTQNDTAGNAIIVVTSWAHSASTVTAFITDTEGNSFVSDNAAANSGTENVSVWHAFNIIGGTKDAVRANFTGSNTLPASVEIIEINGYNALDVSSGSCTGSSNNTAVSSSPVVTTNFASELLIGAGGVNPGGSFSFKGTAGGSFTFLDNALNAADQYESVSSTGSYQSFLPINGAEPACGWISGYYNTSTVLPTGFAVFR